MSILEVKNVSIRYRTGDFKNIGLKEYILRKLKRDYTVEEFWANKNITFSLDAGEMLGIIGTNGAGKSTLLKAVSGIMAPTEGKIQRNGTIAALLELGTGFDKDLTVRENTYLRGAMLGYTRKFMDETYDQIIEFAELQEFQDRPFKQLSSGMRSRLAFSIASLVQPDILILDEVLAVGDGGFRSKSEAKMKEIINSGTTTILVSHSIGQVRQMCDKVLWLDKGQMMEFGDDVQGICDRYELFLQEKRDGAAVKNNQRRHVAAVVAKTGWTYEYAEAQMSAAQERLGMSYAFYNLNNFQTTPEEKQEERYKRILENIRKSKERCIDTAMKDTGWTREYAEMQIESSRKRLGIGYSDYTRYKFHNIPVEQQKETYREIRKKRQEEKAAQVTAVQNQ